MESSCFKKNFIFLIVHKYGQVSLPSSLFLTSFTKSQGSSLYFVIDMISELNKIASVCFRVSAAALAFPGLRAATGYSAVLPSQFG